MQHAGCLEHSHSTFGSIVSKDFAFSLNQLTRAFVAMPVTAQP
jgi:hypothetical protein